MDTTKRRQYDELFKRLNPNNDSQVSATIVKYFLILSGLPDELLTQVWNETKLQRDIPFLNQNMVFDIFDGVESKQSQLPSKFPLKASIGVSIPYFNLPTEKEENDFMPTVEDIDKFSKDFYQLQPTNGTVSGEKISKHFMSFGASQQILSLIWSYIDADLDGLIDESEFVAGSSVLKKLGQSHNIPKFLPTSVIKMIRLGPNMPPRTVSRGTSSYSTLSGSNTLRRLPNLPDQNSSSTPNNPSNVDLNFAEISMDVAKMQKLFNHLDKNNESALTRETMMSLLQNSNLNKEILAKIWDQCGMGNMAKINFDTFAKAIKMISFFKMKTSNSPPTSSTQLSSQRPSQILSQPLPFQTSTNSVSSSNLTDNKLANVFDTTSLSNPIQTPKTIPNKLMSVDHSGIEALHKTLSDRISKQMQSLTQGMDKHFQTMRETQRTSAESIVNQIAPLKTQMDQMQSSLLKSNNDITNLVKNMGDLMSIVEQIKQENLGLAETIKSLKIDMITNFTGIHVKLDDLMASSKEHKFEKESIFYGNGSFVKNKVNSQSPPLVSEGSKSIFTAQESLKNSPFDTNIQKNETSASQRASEILDPFTTGVDQKPIQTQCETNKYSSTDNIFMKVASNQDRDFLNFQSSNAFPNTSGGKVDDLSAENVFGQSKNLNNVIEKDPFKNMQSPFGDPSQVQNNPDPFMSETSSMIFTNSTNRDVSNPFPANAVNHQDPFASNQPFEGFDTSGAFPNNLPPNNMTYDFTTAKTSIFPAADSTENDPFQIKSPFDPFQSGLKGETVSNNSPFSFGDPFNTALPSRKSETVPIKSSLSSGNLPQKVDESKDNKINNATDSPFPSKDDLSTKDGSQQEGASVDKVKKKQSLFKFSTNKKKKEKQADK